MTFVRCSSGTAVIDDDEAEATLPALTYDSLPRLVESILFRGGVNCSTSDRIRTWSSNPSTSAETRRLLRHGKRIELRGADDGAKPAVGLVVAENGREYGEEPARLLVTRCTARF